MPQVVQYTESETCQKSIKCAVQSLWNPVIFSKSCLKVKCRSVLGWPRVKVPWVSHLLPLSSSLVWDGISDKKLTFFSGTKIKVSSLRLLHLPSSAKWVMRDDKFVYSKNKLVYQQRELYPNKYCVSLGNIASCEKSLTPKQLSAVRTVFCVIWCWNSPHWLLHWLNKCIPDLL